MPGKISCTAEWPAEVKGQSQTLSSTLATPSRSTYPLTAHHPRTALLLLLCFHPGQREDQEGSSGCGEQDLHKALVLRVQRILEDIATNFHMGKGQTGKAMGDFFPSVTGARTLEDTFSSITVTGKKYPTPQQHMYKQEVRVSTSAAVDAGLC